MKKASSGKKNYYEVKVLSSANLSDAISNFLTELGSAGVIFKEEKNKTTLSGYFLENSPRKVKFTQLRSYLNQLKQIHPQYFLPKIYIREIQVKDWSENWRKNFKPILVTKNMVIKAKFGGE